MLGTAKENEALSIIWKHFWWCTFWGSCLLDKVSVSKWLCVLGKVGEIIKYSRLRKLSLKIKKSSLKTQEKQLWSWLDKLSSWASWQNNGGQNKRLVTKGQIRNMSVSPGKKMRSLITTAELSSNSSENYSINSLVQGSLSSIYFSVSRLFLDSDMKSDV